MLVHADVFERLGERARFRGASSPRLREERSKEEDVVEEQEVRAMVHDLRRMSSQFRAVVTRFAVILAEVCEHRVEHERRQHPARLWPRTWTH